MTTRIKLFSYCYCYCCTFSLQKYVSGEEKGEMEPDREKDREKDRERARGVEREGVGGALHLLHLEYWLAVMVLFMASPLFLNNHRPLFSLFFARTYVRIFFLVSQQSHPLLIAASCGIRHHYDDCYAETKRDYWC